MANLCVGQDFSEELTCAVCLDSWKDPIELSPCGHIFCRECASGLKECPVCREKIESSSQPNRTLVNMALQIRVKCMRCGWQGTREQGMRHVCGSGPSSSTEAGRPSSIKPPEPPQHPSAANTSSPYAPYSYPPNQPTSGGGYSGYPPRPANSSDLWQSGAPTHTPSPPNNYQGGYQGSYSPPYPCAAPPPSNNYSPNYSPNPANSGGYQGYPGYLPQGQQQPPAPSRGSRRYEVIEPTGNYPWTLYNLGQNEYDQIVSLFVFFDEDDSGSLDRNEVARLARWLNFANTPQDVQRIFDDMDADHSGSLSLGEFLSWLRYNKPNPQALYGLTQSQYNTIMMQFHTYDTNQDGCLEMNEFTRLVLNLRDVKDDATARRLFQMIDRDRDGAINLHEFLTFRAGKSC
jgi:Ca2+-binding EF-hand superfamily protein